MRRLVVSGLFFAALLVTWHALSVAGIWSPMVLPPPASVGRYVDSNGSAAPPPVPNPEHVSESRRARHSTR